MNIPKVSTLRSGALLIGPYSLYVFVLLVIPFSYVALISVYTYSPSGNPIPDLTLANYARDTGSYFLKLFWRTIWLAAVTTAICAVLAYPLAYFLARAKPLVVTIGVFLLVAPLMISTVIRIFGWMVILGRNGVINKVLALFGLETNSTMLYTEGAVIIGMTQLYLPFMVLPLMASIERISPDLEEAARNLGASGLRAFRAVILPLSIPGLVSGALLVFAGSVSAYITPALMGGARVRMVGQQIYDEVLISLNWPGAASVSMILAVATVIILVALLYVSKRATHRVS